jgi:hypothetical protein
MSKRRLLIVKRDEAETYVLLSLFQFAFLVISLQYRQWYLTSDHRNAVG